MGDRSKSLEHSARQPSRFCAAALRLSDVRRSAIRSLPVQRLASLSRCSKRAHAFAERRGPARRRTVTERLGPRLLPPRPNEVQRAAVLGAETATLSREAIGSLCLSPSRPPASKSALPAGPKPEISVPLGRVQAGDGDEGKGGTRGRDRCHFKWHQKQASQLRNTPPLP